MWDERFSGEEFAYGKSPNRFLAAELTNLTAGKALFPAEGEGRNAVYAATLGWQVFAFDSSAEGKRKAHLLADEMHVAIEYQLASYEEIAFEPETFDMIALIYAHHPNRAENHRKLLQYLKPGGRIILEGFSKNQLGNPSGGPKAVDQLYSVEEIKSDFGGLSQIDVWEEDTTLDEGAFHQGKASVIRMTGVK